MDYEKKYNEALEKARKRVSLEPQDHIDAILKGIFPELRESEDERIRKLLVWQVHRNIEDDTNDLAGSVYDGVKGHDPDLEESIEDWKKCLAWLEKRKEQKEQKPAEWSERENKMLESAISHIRDSECFDHFHDITKEDIISWLRSLRPQPKQEWSEEDEDNLHRVIRVLKDNDSDWKELSDWLKSLRPQSKQKYEQ